MPSGEPLYRDLAAFGIQVLRANPLTPRLLVKESRRRKRFLASSPHKGALFFTYEALPDVDTTIRLLTVLPGTAFDDIHCGLECASLHHAEYEAVSYHWGDSKRLSPVTCNGVRIDITRNLKQALSDLRLVDQPRTLWVDAICIDQNNLVEKQSQVKMMGDIYHTARRTLIHLGPSIAGVELAFGAVRAFHRIYQSLVAGVESFASVMDDIKPGMFIEGYKKKVPLVVLLITIGLLTPLSYFSRIWIVQVSFLKIEIFRATTESFQGSRVVPAHSDCLRVQ